MLDLVHQKDRVELVLTTRMNPVQIIRSSGTAGLHFCKMNVNGTPVQTRAPSNPQQPPPVPRRSFRALHKIFRMIIIMAVKTKQKNIDVQLMNLGNIVQLRAVFAQQALRQPVLPSNLARVIHQTGRM